MEAVKTNNEMKPIFDAILLFATFAASVLFSVGLGLDWIYIGAAICGSAGGAIVLAYFRRDHRRLEQFFKSLAASVSGLVLGGAAQTYLDIWTPQYVLALFFCSSFLSLVVLRAALNVSEKHAADVLKDAFRRALLPLAAGRSDRDSRRGKKNNSKGENNNELD